MPFVIQCDNKGCHREQEPLLDVDTNQAICSECNNPITNITDFAKRQMKALGQIKKSKKEQPFAMQCMSCKKINRPSIIDDKIFCPACTKEITTASRQFIAVLKEALKNK